MKIERPKSVEAVLSDNNGEFCLPNNIMLDELEPYISQGESFVLLQDTDPAEAFATRGFITRLLNNSVERNKKLISINDDYIQFLKKEIRQVELYNEYLAFESDSAKKINEIIYEELSKFTDFTSTLVEPDKVKDYKPIPLQ